MGLAMPTAYKCGVKPVLEEVFVCGYACGVLGSCHNNVGRSLLAIGRLCAGQPDRLAMLVDQLAVSGM